jgi:hypothetical protein
MLLTNQQIVTLSEAIVHLDGHHLTQIVEGKAAAIFKSYRLAHTARWLLARAQGALLAAIEDFNRAKDALINHHSGGAGGLNSTSPNFKQFSEDFEKLKQQTVELDLATIRLEHLKLEENEKVGNEMPIAVLHALAPLIELNQPTDTHA